MENSKVKVRKARCVWPPWGKITKYSLVALATIGLTHTSLAGKSRNGGTQPTQPTVDVGSSGWAKDFKKGFGAISVVNVATQKMQIHARDANGVWQQIGGCGVSTAKIPNPDPMAEKPTQPGFHPVKAWEPEYTNPDIKGKSGLYWAARFYSTFGWFGRYQAIHTPPASDPGVGTPKSHGCVRAPCAKKFYDKGQEFKSGRWADGNDPRKHHKKSAVWVI